MPSWPPSLQEAAARGAAQVCFLHGSCMRGTGVAQVFFLWQSQERCRGSRSEQLRLQERHRCLLELPQLCGHSQRAVKV